MIMVVITKEDREMRKAFVDNTVPAFVGTGMALSTAKRKATEQFDKEFPWFKAGSTRGKR